MADPSSLIRQKEIHNTIVNSYRAYVGNYYVKNHSNDHLMNDDDLLSLHSLTSTEALIRLSRVSFYPRYC